MKFGPEALDAFQRLEKLTGRPHPAMEDHKPVHPAFAWMQDAYFRMHNRRGRTDYGTLQPIRHEDIVVFGERVLQISSKMMPFFSRVMESTDNAVLKAISEKRS